MDNKVNPSTEFEKVRLVVLLVFLLLPLPCPGQAADKNRVLSAVADENTAVRFFYQPGGGNYFHLPLVFRVVGQNDPRMKTAPIALEGRFAFVSLSEMQHLLGRLARSKASWRESDKVEAFGPSHTVRGAGYLDITVISPKGTATGSVERNSICGFLASLDSAITTPRALWEFQKFRWDDACDVPDFNSQAYPDHYRYE